MIVINRMCFYSLAGSSNTLAEEWFYWWSSTAAAVVLLFVTYPLVVLAKTQLWDRKAATTTNIARRAHYRHIDDCDTEKVTKVSSSIGSFQCAGEDLKFACRGVHGFNVAIVRFRRPITMQQRQRMQTRATTFWHHIEKARAKIFTNGTGEIIYPPPPVVIQETCHRCARTFARDVLREELKTKGYGLPASRIVLPSHKKDPNAAREAWFFGHHAVFTGVDARAILRYICGPCGNGDDLSAPQVAYEGLRLPRGSLLSSVVSLPSSLLRVPRFLSPYPPTDSNIISCNFDLPGHEYFFSLPLRAIKNLRICETTTTTIPFAVCVNCVIQVLIYAASSLRSFNSTIVVAFEGENSKYHNNFGIVPIRTTRPRSLNPYHREEGTGEGRSLSRSKKSIGGSTAAITTPPLGTKLPILRSTEVFKRALYELIEQETNDFYQNRSFAVTSYDLLHVPRMKLFDSFVRDNFFLSTVSLPIFDERENSISTPNGRNTASVGEENNQVQQIRLLRMDHGIPVYAFCATNGAKIDVSIMTKHHLVSPKKFRTAISTLRDTLSMMTTMTQ